VLRAEGAKGFGGNLTSILANNTYLLTQGFQPHLKGKYRIFTEINLLNSNDKWAFTE
jgi:hypothetical protein